MSLTKKISQKDLRQMMKERKELQRLSKQSTEPSEVKAIESPLARCEANGRITCIICNQSIDSSVLWSQHIVSKSHKNKIEEIKGKKMSQKLIKSKTNAKTNKLIDSKQEEVKPLLKRKLETNYDEITNKLAKNSIDIKTDNKNNSETNSMPISGELESGLPNDFFDEPKQMVIESREALDSKDEEMGEPDKAVEPEANRLPKGFFDDPVMDAKARKVVFKDPIDEQWEQFQKVIAEENTVSENIIEEDVEELQIDRSLEEIEEQIANWIKVNEMQKKAELLHNYITKNSDTNALKEESSDSEVDDQELNVFSNWRTRTGLNSK